MLVKDAKDVYGKINHMILNYMTIETKQKSEHMYIMHWMYCMWWQWLYATEYIGIE